MNNKFTMELVWHNCLNCPPREIRNDNLYISDGTYVSRVEYDRYRGCGRWWDADSGNFIPSQELSHYWWADIAQTVQGAFRLIK